MFKITVGALLGSLISIFLPTRRQRVVLFCVFFAIFAALEIIFIAHGGD